MKKKQPIAKDRKAGAVSKPASATKYLPLLAAIFAFLLYSPSIGYEYTLDDDVYFIKHKSVQKGLSGTAEIFSRGSLADFDNSEGLQPYRPFYLFVFALEKTVFGQSPAISHFINVLFYALLAASVLVLLRKLFLHSSPYFSLLVGLLFIVHPVHTEVVASVKSRDEIIAALFGILAWSKLLNYKDHGKTADLIASVSFFAFASFSKESAIAFLVIYPLSILFFRNENPLNALRTTIPFAAVTAVYLLARSAALGSSISTTGIPVLNNFLNAANSPGELYATRLEVLWYGLKLSILPWPLSWDYSFNQIPIMDFSDLLPWLSLVVHAILLVSAIVLYKKHPILSFGVLFFLITSSPTNNFFYLSTNFGERLLFAPVLGTCMVIAFIIARVSKAEITATRPETGKAFRYISVSLILAFAFLSATRSSDWKNNLALFKAGVVTSPNSCRAHSSYANELFRTANKTSDGALRVDYLNKSTEHYIKSIGIFPDNFDSYYNFALVCATKGDTASAIMNYRKAITLRPGYIAAMNNLGVIYQSQMQFDSAATFFEQIRQMEPSNSLASGNLSNLFYTKGLFYSQKGDRETAVNSYAASIRYNPSNIMSLNNLASLYARESQYDSALVYLKKGFAINGSDMMIIENIAAVSYLARQYDQAIEFARRALTMNPNSRKSLGVLADCYQATGNMQEAMKYRQRIAALQPAP